MNPISAEAQQKWHSRLSLGFSPRLGTTPPEQALGCALLPALLALKAALVGAGSSLGATGILPDPSDEEGYVWQSLFSLRNGRGEQLLVLAVGLPQGKGCSLSSLGAALQDTPAAPTGMLHHRPGGSCFLLPKMVAGCFTCQSFFAHGFQLQRNFFLHGSKVLQVGGDDLFNAVQFTPNEREQ